MDPQDKTNLAAIVTIVVLVAAGLWLMSTLRRQSAIEDCLMQGRRNCDAALAQ